MNLSMADSGKDVCILKINGKDETRKFLANLGFIAGVNISVVSKLNGNVIVNIKDSRVALSSTMANRIIVREG